MNALHLALLLRPEGPDIDLLVAKLEGESLDLPIIEAIRLYAEPVCRSWNQDKDRMEDYHSGKTISRVIDDLMPPDDDPGPSMLSWSVQKAITIAEANAIRRARFPNNQPPGNRKVKASDEVQAKAQCGKCRGTGKGEEVWYSVGGTYGPHPTKCDECSGSGKAPAARKASA